MKMVKISSDKIQIKSNSAEFDKLKINDLLKVFDDNSTLIVKVSQLIDSEGNEETSVFDNYRFLKIIECDILGSTEKDKFSKSIKNYPTSKVEIEIIDNDYFNKIMQSTGFKIGNFANYNVSAFIDGNKFFQKHACIVGNTGSGKSETLSKILEEMSNLKSSNAIVFDIHGEYGNFSYAKTFKIGVDTKFPIWFFTLNDIISNILKLKDETATNLINAVKLCSNIKDYNKISFFDFERLLDSLILLNSQEIETGEFYKTGDKAGMAKTTKGEYNGKLSGIINQLNAFYQDKINNFLFEKCKENYFIEFADNIFNSKEQVKIIDLSEIPHDLAIYIIGIITKMVYEIQLLQIHKNPITIVCDEAHIYIPNNFNLSASEKRMVEIFEIIAKEGRKFGVTLLVASQRPSELNKTIMAQCGNFIVGKLNNENDKQMMKAMLPDGADSIIDDTTMYAPGEAVLIGDCFPISLKIKIDLAEERPQSRNIDFWDVWQNKEKSRYCFDEYVRG